MVPNRINVITQLANLVIEIRRSHPIRVAVDGVDGSGKTTLADELAVIIKKHDRSVIRASVDGFHNPKTIRYRQGVNSPDGYYRDSFNYSAIVNELLTPLGPGGNRRYRRKVYDYHLEGSLVESQLVASPNAVLLFDGVFLLRPILIDFWDFSIFIDVDFDVSVQRAVTRDMTQIGEKLDAEAVRNKYYQHYVPGQQLYLREEQPKTKAIVVIENNDLEAPILR